jgi:hypothetical protein
MSRAKKLPKPESAQGGCELSNHDAKRTFNIPVCDGHIWVPVCRTCVRHYERRGINVRQLLEERVRAYLNETYGPPVKEEKNENDGND